MSKFSEIVWPSEYSELKRIEELLVCGICYNYMETSVMTPCSHNYCSLCIRKFLHYKNQCPACFQDTFEKDLHTNRLIDEIILYFSKVRDKLVTCITGAQLSSAEPKQEQTTPPVRPARSNHHLKSPDLSKPRTPSTKPPPLSPARSLSSPSTSGSSKVPTIFTPKSHKTESKAPLVPCPVCRVEISEVHINKHLDDCLKRESMPQAPVRITNKRKPLPKLVLCLMKDLELKKKMKALNLSIRGDRKTLENRYYRYCTLYNAECDKLSPRSVEEVLKQCEDEEEQERSVQEAKQNGLKLMVSRSASQNVIDSAQKQYLESNKDKFDSLIEQIKSRKPSVRRSLLAEDSEESSKDDWNPRPMFESAFQDDDSSDGCLLQTYTSEHPNSFLPLRISDDSVSPKKMESREVPKSSSVFDLSTESETDSDFAGDEGVVKVEMKRTKMNHAEKFNGMRSDAETDAKSIAQAIARDFCDDCSNDSGDSKCERNKDSSRISVDKENETVNDNIARRPVRKRNHPSRFGEQEGSEGRASQPTRLGSIETLKEEIKANKGTLSPKDGAMKRRRRRKCLSPSEEQIPPRRPVRRRDSNLIQDSANESINID